MARLILNILVSINAFILPFAIALTSLYTKINNKENRFTSNLLFWCESLEGDLRFFNKIFVCARKSDLLILVFSTFHIILNRLAPKMYKVLDVD